MPTWLNNKQLVITKTQNGGWSVGPEKNSLPQECVVFETYGALTYWLSANWAAPAP
ncbi:hypothetical protein [Stenotrophomonas maltophilia]|uniref:hypothetical protein n=1 Tax=Stenotrophomonas maltophilia TaxID=40324 RepID=UPI003BF83744